MNLLKRWAWKILGEEIKENYIHRNDIATYTKWMSRDFPVMEVMQYYFDSCKTSREIIARMDNHRQGVATFYFGHPMGSMRPQDTCTNQPH